ncbi:MAG: hypothetical protein P8Y28_14690 [Gammaproteobacteria bacterium]|jgi:energy-coupling factor transporter transmembrane protein EcfT
MNKHKLIFIILVFVAIILSITKSMQPGGGSIPWFIVLLLLTLVSYYYGFVEKSRNPFRFYAQGGFVTFLLLTFLMAYIARNEDKGLEEISRYIAVYPNVESINFIPRTSNRTIQHWQIKTSDPVEHIKEFYSNPKNLRDWQIVRKEPMLVLEKNNYKLTISFTEHPRISQNYIFYHIENK